MKVFSFSVSVLVASEANKTSLFKTIKVPFPMALSEIAVQTEADKLLGPSYPSSELLHISTVTTIGLAQSILMTKK